MKSFIYDVKSLNDDEKKEINNFFRFSQLSYFKQSIEYLDEKTYKRYILLIKENSEIILGCFIDIEKTFMGNILKICGGPIIKDDIDTACFENFLKKDVFELGKKEKVYMYILSTNFKKTFKGFEDKIISSGYIKLKEKNKIKDRINSPYYFYIPLKSKELCTIYKELSAKTRYNIRIAEAKNIYTEKEKLINFNEIKKEYIPFKENINIYRVIKDKLILAKIYILEYGNKTYLLDILENEKNQDFEYAKYLGVWECIKDSKDKDLFEFNLMGFPGLRTKEENIPPYSMYRFKKSFGAILFEKLSEYIYIVNEFKYNMYKTFLKKS